MLKAISDAWTSFRGHPTESTKSNLANWRQTPHPLENPPTEGIERLLPPLIDTIADYVSSSDANNFLLSAVTGTVQKTNLTPNIQRLVLHTWRNVTTLDVNTTAQLCPDDVVHISCLFPRIVTLSAQTRHFPDSDLVIFTAIMPKLQKLSLSGCTEMTKSGAFDEISRLKHIREVHLTGVMTSTHADPILLVAQPPQTIFINGIDLR